MTSDFFILLSISRYLRAVLFCVIMMKFYELGEGEVDRQIRVIIMTLVLIVIVTSGVFSEIENSQNLVSIAEDGSDEFTSGYTYIYFHDALYFVVVTLFTVGYGDINAVNELSKVCTMLLIVLTVVLVPQQTSDLLKLFSMWSVYRKIEYNSAELKHVVVTGHISI